jgi:hypothetical protein
MKTGVQPKQPMGWPEPKDISRLERLKAAGRAVAWLRNGSPARRASPCRAEVHWETAAFKKLHLPLDAGTRGRGVRASIKADQAESNRIKAEKKDRG